MVYGSIDWGKKYMKEKQRVLGLKVKPVDVTDERRGLVSNLSGSSDMVDVIYPIPGDVYVCEDCLRKFASYDGLVLQPVQFVLDGSKCTFCKRPLWPLAMRGKKIFMVRRIQLTIPEIWRILGNQKKRSAKYEGSRLW